MASLDRYMEMHEYWDKRMYDAPPPPERFIDYKQKYNKLLSLMKRVNEELFGEVKFIDYEDLEQLKKEIKDAIKE